MDVTGTAGPQTEGDLDARAAKRPRRAWGRLFFALVLLLLVVLAALWLQRRTITREFVDRELARRGVPAQYRIEQLSPWRQRLTDVVVGDPRNPDLTADWIELRTALSPWRAEVLVIRAGRVRARGTLRNGSLSLGEIDKLLPAPSGAPFALPDLSIDVKDARLRLASPSGTVDLSLSGKGLLSDGFRGTLSAAAPRIAVAGCTVAGAGAALRVRVRNRTIGLSGPVQAARATCGEVRAERARVTIDGSVSEAFDRWRGRAEVAAARLAGGELTGSMLDGRLGFTGTAAGTEGTLDLRLDAFAAAPAAGRALRFAGRYGLDSDGVAFEGTASARSVRLADALLRQVRDYPRALSATPLGPLAVKAAGAVGAAARDFDLSGDIAFRSGGDGIQASVSQLRLAARSGARLRLAGAGAPGLEWRDGLRADGTLTVRGGGLPEVALRITHRAGNKVRGTGVVRTYRAGNAALALDRIVFEMEGATGRFASVATLSGPVPGGEVDRLAMPLTVRWGPQGWTANPGCETARFAALRLGGARLGATALRLCPTGPAMVRGGARGLAGGVALAGNRLAGTLGATPFSLGFDDARVDLGEQDFALSGVRATLGAERVSELAIERLDGGFADALGGAYTGLSGAIGGVPIHVSEGAGGWRFDEAGLALDGNLRLHDAAEPARFLPMRAERAEIRISGDAVTAIAGLRTPQSGIAVGQVRIAHDLARGSGTAVVDIPGLRFAEGGFQPSDLTPLTFGVVADVSGQVSGRAEIAWDAAGVTSGGTFSTESLDLAAAFGPVRGLSTEIRFVDLLGMRTAPGQTAAIAEVNPGVPVADGKVRYRILDSRRVQVEGARWPFAGGELVLEPTLLDFSERRERRLTFQIKGADAALFLNEMGFDNMDATGIFDGTLPMIFDASGGRIEGGFLRARAGGSLAYVGEISQQDLGFWGNMAFEALKSLDYERLEIGMSGPLAGEMITEISFAGVSQGEGARSNFLIRRLAKLPFVFNVRISAPFYQLLDSVRSWYDPKRLIERNLPGLLDEEAEARGIQPGESTDMGQGEPK